MDHEVDLETIVAAMDKGGVSRVILSPRSKLETKPFMAFASRHLDRFILAFDNVWEWNWGDMYLRQIGLWRKALNDLQASAAHALAHQNAERPGDFLQRRYSEQTQAQKGSGPNQK